VKLDPEERIIDAALDDAELDNTNDRGAHARIEFMRVNAREIASAGRSKNASRAEAEGWPCSGQ
jgi:hypothetical protein